MPPATATPDIAGEIAHINDAERQWKALGIASYRVVYKYTAAFNFEMTVDTTVRNGQVQQPVKCDSSRLPDCTRLKPEELPVDYLFAEARVYVRESYCATTIGFSRQYFFPSSLDCENAPGVADGQHSKAVLVFTELP